ncbi:MAG: hypothetical protein WC796_00905 [Candidatus Pacearchaeota archaeon]|jgi:hypothetical protein
MNREDLVILRFASNTAYVQACNIEDIVDKDFALDFEGGKWSYKNWENVSIGTNRNSIGPYPGEYRQGVIGVYDRTNTEHLDAMVHATIAATRTLQNGWACGDD